MHHTAKLSSHCVLGPGTFLSPNEDTILNDYSVVHGSNAVLTSWSGNGKVQEADLRLKHVEYLRDMLPKFNRLRQTAGA
jgi:dynactin 6